MTDRPIIFSAPLVRALLDDRKTQTRRVLKEASDGFVGPNFRRGDRLYVREAHSLHHAYGQSVEVGSVDDGFRWGPWGGLQTQVSPDKKQIAYFREGFDRSGAPRWRPSIHMPRWASRLTLTVTDVRVQRLQEISEADAKAEGVGVPRTHDLDGGPIEGVESVFDGTFCADHRDAMQHAWQSLHGPGEWAANRWVVAVSFTVQHGNIDQIGGAA